MVETPDKHSSVYVNSKEKGVGRRGSEHTHSMSREKGRTWGKEGALAEKTGSKPNTPTCMKMP